MSSQGTSRIRSTVGANLRAARLAKGLTQAELARALGDKTNEMLVSKWERGIHRPQDFTMERLAVILDIEFVDFYDEERAA